MASETTPPIVDGVRVTKPHYGILCKQLVPVAANWKKVAWNLGFTRDEIQNIEQSSAKFSNTPDSFMDEVISRWVHWFPKDPRGSKSYATIEALKKAVDRVGATEIAETLTLGELKKICRHANLIIAEAKFTNSICLNRLVKISMMTKKHY